MLLLRCSFEGKILTRLSSSLPGPLTEYPPFQIPPRDQA